MFCEDLHGRRLRRWMKQRDAKRDAANSAKSYLLKWMRRRRAAKSSALAANPKPQNSEKVRAGGSEKGTLKERLRQTDVHVLLAAETGITSVEQDNFATWCAKAQNGAWAFWELIGLCVYSVVAAKAGKARRAAARRAAARAPRRRPPARRAAPRAAA